MKKRKLPLCKAAYSKATIWRKKPYKTQPPRVYVSKNRSLFIGINMLSADRQPDHPEHILGDLFGLLFKTVYLFVVRRD